MAALHGARLGDVRHPGAPMVRAPFDDEGWKRRLREAGLRATAPRMGLLRALSASPLPIPAPDLLDAIERESGERADRVTAYRTLTSLVEAGIAHRVDPGDRVWRYGLLAFEGAAGAPHGHHPHFVCDACGTIRCLADATISVSYKGRPGSDKLRVTQQDVYLHGTCEACETAAPTAARAARARPGPARSRRR